MIVATKATERRIFRNFRSVRGWKPLRDEYIVKLAILDDLNDLVDCWAHRSYRPEDTLPFAG